MTAFRILLLLMLCLAEPTGAAPAVRWTQCDAARPSLCRRVMPEQLALDMPRTTLSAIVTVPPDSIHEPLAVDIDAMASVEIRWNGVPIGRNGVPGPDRASEVPGRFSFSAPVPPSLVRAGENRVTITLSAHHLWLPVAQPIHRLAIGPPLDADAYTLRHYLPTLATLALPLGVLLLLCALLIAGRIGKPALLPMAILAVVVVQGLLEVSKVVLPYTYPWQLARLVVLAGLTAIAGLLLVLLACRLVLPLRARAATVLTAAAMLTACLFVSGPDRQALAMFGIALIAAMSLAMPAAMRGERKAIALAAMAVALAAWAWQVGPNFLDVGYYLTAAGAAVVLGLATVLRPVQVIERRLSIAMTEPAVTLRDGACRHILAPSQIVFLKAADDYCTVHMADGRQIMVTMTLKAILSLLPAGFLRIHRSHAINMAHLSGMRPGPSGRVVHLADGTTLPVGRTYAAALSRGIAETAGTPSSLPDPSLSAGSVLRR
ncbi:LytTR family DNA-binding domain-containing protein [Sphingobium lignivorans]|uniref:DNA-binding LytR/AlgR family response regulator n=1 Tax=Sphingobium lignivorans TaxID=2735886 RepID=A0ABR6NFL5_9SPHN|nr:LytTR family DNA-binding domain-containing protein [Sphingobium lignivorans]MBB5986069.1 DNA-binding LytR/AlgR family response regulator [Sphingobium lignivorans]